MAFDGVIVADGPERRRSADNPVDGDTFYADSTGGELVRVPIGGVNTVYKSDGSVPSWQTFLPEKAGRVLVGSFSGNPNKATVTFGAAFADANYAVTVTAVSSVGGTTYSPSVEAQVAGSFVINLGSNQTTNLVQVNWVAVKDGETT